MIETGDTYLISRIHADSNNEMITDYAELLRYYNLEYRPAGYYLQVGDIEAVGGWILHLSVIRSQLQSFFETVIPFLADERMSFKIVKDKETARNLLDGNLGNFQIGKIISVYPNSGQKACQLAKKLVDLTKEFRGPAVLTDIHLGSIVYTRYGSFNPIVVVDASGNEVKLIHDVTGSLVKDEYYIPFKMPEGIVWPYYEITNPVVPKKKSILKQIYKPITNLKSDPRGDVIKALYLKKFYDVRWCVIKQGIKNMWSDDMGRDIPDRLIWQNELHKELGHSIALPKALDLFSENGNSYLVIEYCKGKSLHTRILGLNRNSIAWYARPGGDQVIVLGYVLKVIEILDKLHQNGFVHRDVTPVNFLIDHKDRLIPIDLELVYSLKTKTPTPPFFLGTKGFMSPEQEGLSIPTIKEDIYGLGATMIVMFTGLSPIVFSTEDSESLYENINFFIRYQPLSRMISTCLHPDPAIRPDLDEIENCIVEYRDHLQQYRITVKPFADQKSGSTDLKKVIDEAVRGLAFETLLAEDLWVSSSFVDEASEKRKEEFLISPGLRSGLSGVMYLLSKLRLSGIEITTCEKSFKKSWQFIEQNYLQEIATAAPGFYGGMAGVALAISYSIKAGLIEDNKKNRDYIEQCLQVDNSAVDMSNGVTGQGIAALQCREWIRRDALQNILEKCLEKLYSSRDKKGYWVWQKGKFGGHKNATSFSHGNTGIVWFLLEYASQYRDEQAKELAMQSVIDLCGELRVLKHLLKKHGFHKTFQNKIVWDSITSILLVLVKAYECSNHPTIKKQAEETLLAIPANIVTDNFEQETGLAGLGELYLEAARVFKRSEWNQRADWIAITLMHTRRKGSGGCYWLSNNTSFATADFMTGNGGIVHFLLRHLDTGIGFRLLE